MKLIESRHKKSVLSGFSASLASLVSNLASTGRVNKQGISIVVDAIIALVCVWLAYSLRLERLYLEFGASWLYFIAMPLITITLFAGLGIYRWVIRSSNSRLQVQLIKGSLLSATALLILMFLSPYGGPRSIFAIYFLLLLGGTIGVRTIWQLLVGGTRVDESAEPVAIYGAGRHGHELAALMSMSPDSHPVLFLDDNPKLAGSTIAGLPVFDPAVSGLNSLFESNEITRVILASQRLDQTKIKSLLSSLDLEQISVQTVPTISEIVSGRAKAGETREIAVSDLLGRNEVAPNAELLSAGVVGKHIMVTGGGGSIGSEICRQIVLLKPLTLVILEQSEENLYKISEDLYELLETLPEAARCEFVPLLGSVLDKKKIDHLLSKYHIEAIYHAAAYKHVPIVEQSAEEGFRTNVFGTRTVLDCAIANNVQRFVLISTDKAVRPTNVMGATKRLAELVLQAKADQLHNTTICMVRFGNVLGSSGSVIPKFKRQIAAGGPMTVTHKEVTRYFMSIPEASQLVLQAGSLGLGGEVFVLDMGDPVKIVDLAQNLVYLSGKSVKSADNPNGDIEIKTTGLRPGEKLYEEMFISDDAERTSVSKIFVAREEMLPWPALERRLIEIEEAISAFSPELPRLVHQAIVDLETSNLPETISIERSKTSHLGKEDQMVAG